MKTIAFVFKCHWSLFLRLQLSAIVQVNAQDQAESKSLLEEILIGRLQGHMESLCHNELTWLQQGKSNSERWPHTDLHGSLVLVYILVCIIYFIVTIVMTLLIKCISMTTWTFLPIGRVS